MIKQLPLRQRIRKALILVMFLLFAVTMNFFSPALVLMASSQGIVNGSLMVFLALFLGSLVLGRAWCGWVCPAGGLQELAEPVNREAANGRKLDWIKWLIWLPWVTLIVLLAWKAGGYHLVDLLYGTQHGLSLAGDADRPIQYAYVIFYGVILLILLPALLAGRRAFCHSLCWMAPFMILGYWVNRITRLPTLRLAARPSTCSHCQTCTRNCPMSLDVDRLVRLGDMDHTECILCGSCVDNCPSGSIRYHFGQKPEQE